MSPSPARGMIKGGGLVETMSCSTRCAALPLGQRDRPRLIRSTRPSRLGNKAIALKLCRNVLIRDITIVHGGHFAILATGCDNMTVDNVTIDTNRDGIDIDCCRNTAVSNCRVNSPNDDAICPKSSYRARAQRPHGKPHHHQLPGLRFPGRHPARRHDEARPNETAASSSAPNPAAASATAPCPTARSACCKGLALEEVDGGIMENITITNLSMMDVMTYAIYIPPAPAIAAAPFIGTSTLPEYPHLERHRRPGWRAKRHPDIWHAGTAPRKHPAGQHPAR